MDPKERPDRVIDWLTTLKEWPDRVIEQLISIGRRVIELDFDRAWFAWVEWLILSSAVYAAGKKTGSLALLAVGVFSAGVLILSTWFRTERFLVGQMVRTGERPLLLFILVMVAIVLPVGLMFLLVRLFLHLVQVVQLSP